MKKILIFSLVYYPRFVGGAEVAVKEITDRIPPSEISFDMVALRSVGESPVERLGNVTIYRKKLPLLPFSVQKLLFPFIAYFRARKLNRENQYDAAWSIMANYAGFGAMFFKWKHPRVPFILTLQEGDSLEHIRHRVGIMYPLFKKIFTKADKIQTISTFLAEWARYMGATAHVYVVPNGVDIKKFEARSSKLEERGELRKKVGIKPEEKVVITTSRLVEKNGVGNLIESLRYLPDNVKLLILGSGVLESDLKLKAKSYQLEARVKFVGFVPHAELPSYLHAADVFCRPSLSEGLGNSFLEAMAAGLPVVATPVGGIPDFLKDSETGLFCEVNNPKSIAEKAQLLLSNTELRNRIISNASKMVRVKYEWNFIAEKMKNVFEFERRLPA